MRGGWRRGKGVNGVYHGKGRAVGRELRGECLGMGLLENVIRKSQVDGSDNRGIKQKESGECQW